MDRDVDVAKDGLGVSHAGGIVDEDARGWRLEQWHLVGGKFEYDHEKT